MKTIKAQVEIEIFDDPEYCNSEAGMCPKLTGPAGCKQFGDIDRNIIIRRTIKHDKCKTAYQKAKIIRDAPIWKCGYSCPGGRKPECDKRQSITQPTMCLSGPYETDWIKI